MAYNKKTRYLIPCGEGQVKDDLIQLDRWHDHDEGVITIDVEFDDIEQKEGFVPPEWFGRETTDDPNYTSKSLAQNGFPEEAYHKED